MECQLRVMPGCCFRGIDVVAMSTLDGDATKYLQTVEEYGRRIMYGVQERRWEEANEENCSRQDG